MGASSIVFHLVAGRDIGVSAERSAVYMKPIAAIESLAPAIGGIVISKRKFDEAAAASSWMEDSGNWHKNAAD